jgi:hypothetical protein
MKMYGEVLIWLHVFLNFALDGGEWSTSRFGRFTPEVKPTRLPIVKEPGCGPQSWSGYYGGEKNLLPLSGIGPRLLSCPVRSLIDHHHHR